MRKKTLIYVLFLTIFINIGFAMSEKKQNTDVKPSKNQNVEVKETVNISGLIFKTDKQVYSKAEQVCFTLENQSQAEYILPSSAPYAIFNKEKPEVAIYSPVSAQVITPLKPKEVKKWCWDQKDIEGKEVSSGDYFVRLTIFDKSGKVSFLKADFTIKLK
jgi:hypothetical protein